MINIAKLLKDAPEGMKLYSPLFGEVKFKYINGSQFGIVVEDSVECSRSFDKYGRYFTIYNDAECLLFPSEECRTWENFKLPTNSKFKVGDWVVFNNNHNSIYQISKIKDSFYILIHIYDGSMPLSFSQEGLIRPWTIEDAKDGDVLVTEDYIFIFKHILHGGVHLYCHYGIDDEEFDSDIPDAIIGNIHDKGAHFQPATKEQRDLLFAKMKEAGYKWDADKKELRKVKPHYDIKNFHAGMPVLVRDNERRKWCYTLYSHYDSEKDYPFVTAGDSLFIQCVPYNDDTKHLLGTTDMPSEEYINW